MVILSKNQRRSLGNYHLQIKYDPALQRTLHRLFLYASFSLKQYLILFFNLTQCLLTYWITFVTVYLYSYLDIVDILRSLNCMQCLYTSFRKTSKILVRFNILFLKFSASKFSYYILLSMEHCYLLTAKITRNDSL